MSSQWYYSLFGEEFGPVDEAQLIELRDSGTIGPTDEVRREGETRRLPLSQALNAPAPTSGSGSNIDAVDSGEEEANWYYEMLGQQMGPLSFGELQELAKNGNLRADDQVKFGVEGKYRRVGSIGRLVAVLPYQDSTTVIAPAVPVGKAAPSSAEPPLPSRSDANAQRGVRYARGAEELTWYAQIQGKEYGPTTLVKLSDWLKSGQLGIGDLVRQGSQGQWMPASPTVDRALSMFLIDEPTSVVPASPAAAKSVSRSTPPAFEPLAVNNPPSAAPRQSSATVTQRPATATPSASSPARPAAAAEPTPKPTPRISPTPPETAVTSRPTPVPPNSAPSPAPRPSAVSPAMNGGSSSASSTWGSYGSMSSSKPAAVATPKPAPRPAAKRSSSGGGFSLNLGALTDSNNLPGLIGLAVVGLIGLWFYMPASSGPDRERLQTIQKIVDEMESNRDNKVKKPLWDKFVLDSKPLLKKIKAELDGKTNPRYPAKQYILWASDRLPSILELAYEKPSPQENEVNYYLKKAAFLLGDGKDPDLDLPPPPPEDSSLTPP